MADHDNSIERNLSGVERTTDTNQNDQSQKDRRLNNQQALQILFSVAFLPAYILPQSLTLEDKRCITAWFGTIFAILCISFLFNLITLNILNRVADVKQMNSYQEIAYNISNSNRGYIFLISAAKFIFHAFTAAYDINFCASYLTSLSLLGKMDDPPSAGQTWGIYFAWVMFLGAVIFFFYHKMRSEVYSHEGAISLVTFGYIFGICFIVQTIMMFSTTLASTFHSKFEGTILYDQLVANGNLPSTVSEVYASDPFGEVPRLMASTDDRCSGSQIIVGYLPALFYSNMISLVFLEVKSLTKISESQTQRDKFTGQLVIILIFLAYIVNILPILIASAAASSGDVQKQSFLVAIFNANVAQPNPFFLTRSKMTLFDVIYLTNLIMMIAQAVVNLQIARDNLTTFVQEHSNQQTSKELDWKNRGLDKKKKNKNNKNQRRGPDQNGPGVNAQASLLPGDAHNQSQSDMGSMSKENLLGSHQRGPNEGSDSRVGTVTDRTMQGQGAEAREDSTQKKMIVSISLFVCVILLSLLNCKPNNILAHLWVVIATIVCPLIIMFIPGIFYFRVMKEEEDEEENEEAGCNKFKRIMARLYTFLGALLLPLFLTFSTKALFSTQTG